MNLWIKAVPLPSGVCDRTCAFCLDGRLVTIEGVCGKSPKWLLISCQIHLFHGKEKTVCKRILQSIRCRLGSFSMHNFNLPLYFSPSYGSNSPGWRRRTVNINVSFPRTKKIDNGQGSSPSCHNPETLNHNQTSILLEHLTFKWPQAHKKTVLPG